jgi:DNA-binding transcriptional ArsR family regulator
MKKETEIPICKTDIVNDKNVKKAQKAIKKTGEIFEIANIFKLFGEPTRLKIIIALISGELCVHDLATTLDSTVSSVSHQLRLLRNARLVKFRKEGKMVYYSIEDEHISKLVELVKEHIKE